MSDYRFPSIMGRPITRTEIMEGLREGYDAMLTLAKQDDATTTGFPDMIKILDHIEKHGLPPELQSEQPSDASILQTTRAAIQEMSEALRELSTERDELLYALKFAASTFRVYEDIHKDKETPNGNRKAEANAIIARSLEAVIAKVERRAS